LGYKQEGKKMTPVYENDENKLKILKMGFENQVQYLRMMSDVDLRLFTGYITVQLILGSWLAQHPLQMIAYKLGILIIDWALVALAINAFRVNQVRRAEAVHVLKNLCDALGFTKEGVFLPDSKKIQSSVPLRPWNWLYNLTAILAGIGVTIIILAF